MNVEIQIRNLRDQDFPKLFDLYKHLKSYNENYLVPPNQFHSYIRLNAHLTKVAVLRSEKIIGFIIANRSSSKEAKINAIYVSEEYRKQGTGSRLLMALENDLHQYKGIKYLSIRLQYKFLDSSQFFFYRDFNLVAKINNYLKEETNFPSHPNNNLDIRQARREDIKQLLAVEHLCFDEYWRMDKIKFKEVLINPYNVIFIALLNGRIVGYNFNAISKLSKRGNYIHIATLPEYRQRGIATSLTSKAFEWFRYQGAKSVLLSTFADSQFHNDMYKRWGFTFVDQEIILAKEFLDIKNNSYK